MRIVGAALLCLIAVGCAQVLGLDDYDGQGAGAGDASSQGAGGSGGVGALGGGGGEVEFTVPEGWVVVSLSVAQDEAQPCTAGWHDGLEGGTDPILITSCACSCGTPSGVCPTMGDLVLSAGIGCTGTMLPVTSGLQCSSAGGFTTQSALGTPVLPNATCTPSTSPPPEAGWGTPVKTCVADTPCTPEDCPMQPPGYRDEVCIMRTGPHACPFGTPSNYFATLTNTSTCSCGCDTSSLSCDATTTLYGALACTGAVAQIPHDNNCIDVNFGPANTVQLTATLAGMCTSTTMTNGSVVAEDEVTVCCVPRLEP